jgi:hypothetical protein
MRVRISPDLRKQSGFIQLARCQALNLDMGVRPSQPELLLSAAPVNRRFPEHLLTAKRQRHGADGDMTTEYRRRARFPYLVHCLRSSNAEQPVLTRSDVGSSPTGGTTRTGSLGATLRSQRSLGGFETRRPLHARAVQRVNAGSTCRRSLVRSQPRARSHVVFFQWPRKPGSQSGNTGSIPVHDALHVSDSVF